MNKEKFYLEIPGLKRKEDAIDFINEFYEFNSDISGAGGLQHYLDNYEGWLERLEEDYSVIPNEEIVPARTYFMIRAGDDKIVGIINIRLALNEKLRNGAGNIGYSIRPTERKKGYNKVNLFLGLNIADDYNIEKVLLDADLDNPASWKTIEALGGIKTREEFSNEERCMVRYYEIDTKKSLETYGKKYSSYVFDEEQKSKVC